MNNRLRKWRPYHLSQPRMPFIGAAILINRRRSARSEKPAITVTDQQPDQPNSSKKTQLMSVIACLSSKEWRILELVAEGKTNKY